MIATGTTYGRTDRGGLLPSPEPPIASAFGDTDGEFFCGRKILWPNVASTTVDAEVFIFEMVSWKGLGGLAPLRKLR